MGTNGQKLDKFKTFSTDKFQTKNKRLVRIIKTKINKLIMASTYDTMLKFAPGKLMDIFGEQYAHEHGGNKLQEIIVKIENSEKVSYYINQILKENIKPSAKGLGVLLNTLTYFIFSKAETLCMGGLAVMILWQGKADPFEEIYSEDEIVEICADFIVACSKLKTNISGNFFRHFFHKINLIGQEE